MKLNQLFYQFEQSSVTTKVIIGLVGLIWAIVLLGLLGLGFLMWDRPAQALQPTSGSLLPTISLDPATGSAGSSVTVRGEGWTAGSMVLLYLSASISEDPTYALASAIVDGEGRFSTNLIIPADPQWAVTGSAIVVARTQDNGVSAQASLNIGGGVNPDDLLPTATLISSPTPAVSPTPTATPLPGAPLATTFADLNVRGGPGTAYPVLGLLKVGQTAEITGRSADGEWWQIKFAGVAGERGWLAAKYVTAQNIGNVVVVQAPPLPTPVPPTPTRVVPTPTPLVITDWRGEYYNNPNLSGNPALVRNDVVVSFNWGTNAPAAGLPADGFSARWTRSLGFPEGLYRFWLTVDDGVRVWLDNSLIIDQWHDSAPTTYVAETRLSHGIHQVRIEYYERSGQAQIDLGWQRLSDQTNNQAPQARTGGPYLVDEGGRISLDGSKSKDPDGKIVKYEWDFSYNGHNFNTESTEKYPSAFFADGPNTVTIALRVTDNRGASNTATGKVTVLSIAPSVEAGGPYVGQAGSPVTLTGTASDPSPVDQSGLSYRWEFGDGATANGPVVSHSYNQAGSYTARLIVNDKDGAQVADTATVQINGVNQAPVAVISGPTSGKVGETLAFSGSNSRDNDGSITGYAWNFGDGVTAGGVNASHSYGQAGTYEVTLTVTDNSGLSGSSTITVQISEVVKTPPIAAINGPSSAVVNEPLSFDSTGSKDTDGQIVSYTWNFGDGTTATGFNVSHTYPVSGTYQVTLTVIDNDGLSAQAAQTVTIDALIQLELPPNVMLTAPLGGLVGESLTFDASASSDPDGQIVDYTWNFGDGLIQNGLLITPTHSYSQAGVYTVTLTLTDNDGLINSLAQPVTIN